MSNGNNGGNAQTKPAGQTEQPSNQNANDKVARMAFELFTARRAANSRTMPEFIAVESFRDAEAFVSVSARRANGESVEKMGKQSPLDDCSAPNLKKTHPLNMVSQRFGNPDLKQVRTIAAVLKADPTLDTYGDLEWSAAEVSVARQVFPAVLAKADAN